MDPGGAQPSEAIVVRPERVTQGESNAIERCYRYRVYLCSRSGRATPLRRRPMRASRRLCHAARARAGDPERWLDHAGGLLADDGRSARFRRTAALPRQLQPSDGERAASIAGPRCTPVAGSVRSIGGLSVGPLRHNSQLCIASVHREPALRRHHCYFSVLSGAPAPADCLRQTHFGSATRIPHVSR